MDPESALKTLGRRRMGGTGYPQLDRLRQRVRRQYTVRLWAGRILVTIGYIALTALTVALLVSL